MTRKKTKKQAPERKIGSVEKRIAVIVLHKQAHDTKTIAQLTGIPQRTVQKTLKRWRETGDWKDRPRSGRPPTAVTREMINRISQLS
jgi:transposase